MVTQRLGADVRVASMLLQLAHYAAASATTLRGVRGGTSAVASAEPIFGDTIVCDDHRGQTGAFRYLQPDNMDLLLHGAGQSPAAFRAYWDFMPTAAKPMVFMTYTGLNASSRAHVQAYFAGLEAECASYGDETYVIPQIGLSMTTGGIHGGYDAAVASGAMDEQIGWLVDGLRDALKRPAYIRIGYEFNGEWNGYSPKTYVKAFARVAKAVRATKKVATVWDYSADASADRLNWLDWIVDEELMDWAGVNIFSGNSQPTAPSRGVKGSKQVEYFVEDITEDGSNFIGLMVGESTPRGTGAQNGTESWSTWFGPYFTMLNDGDYNYQSFNYINWDWSNSSEPYYRDSWKSWGNAQIQGTEVGAQYIANMQHPHHQFKYVHGMPRDKLFKIIGCSVQSAEV